jgi:hypothetical protein
MIEDLKLRGKYGGFLFLADAQRGIPWLKTHQHAELEINLVARGSVTYVIGKSSYTFYQGECVWLFQPSPVANRNSPRRRPLPCATRFAERRTHPASNPVIP